MVGGVFVLQSTLQRRGSPVLFAYSVKPSDDGTLRAATLAVQAGLKAGAYRLRNPATGEIVGTLTLPSVYADALRDRFRSGAPAPITPTKETPP